MKKLFLLTLLIATASITWATLPIITIDGDKSDWAEVPMLSEPGTWPMLKVLTAADAELGTNALVYMMENNADFDPTWTQYPTEFIDKDYDGTTSTLSSYWAFDAMGLEYRATTGVQIGEDWVSFPKAMSANNKVFEIGFPATYIADLGSKFAFAMYYNNGAWFCPDYSSPAVSPSNGFLYKTRSFTTITDNTTLTMANVYAHQSIGECIDYVDFGLRDNGNDTARWAAWPLELTQPAMFEVTTNVTSTNGWKFEFWVVDVATNTIVAHLDAPESSVSSSKTSYTFGTLDLTAVPAGKYMLKVKNRTPNSTVKLNSVELAYAGGYVKDIPSTLTPTDAIHNGTIVDGVIKFDDATTGWAKWNVSVASGTYFDIALSIKNKWGHNFTVAVYQEDGTTLVDQVTEGSNRYSANEEGHTLNLGGLYLATGKYVVKITNSTEGSDAKIMSLAFTYAGGAIQTMPGTADINDAWFSANGTRADGKISYTSISGGCWTKWNIALANAGNYSVIVNICGQYGHNYSVEFLKEGETTPIVVTKDDINYTNDPTLYANELGDVELAAGNYMVKVSNAVGDASLISLKLTYKGGAVINLPSAIALNEAILSECAFIDGDGLHFADNDHLGTISDEWAKWNISVAYEGLYKFTAHCSSTNYSNLTITLYNGETELYTFTPQYTYNQADKEINSPEWLLEPGNYVLKLFNPANNSNGYLLSLSASVVSDILIIDENATDNSVIHENNGENAKKILLKRTFVADMYNTICLPFSDWNSSLELVFGTGYELLELVSAELVGNELNLNFNLVSSLGHGRPYLIKPTQNVVNPIFGTGHPIDERTDGYCVKSCTNADFIGSFIKSEVPAGENNLFLGPNDLLYFSQTATPIKGTRAYFQLKGISHPQQAIKHARIVKGTQVITEIDLVKDVKNASIKTIENGQLVIIRDGIRYNAMGIRLQ